MAKDSSPTYARLVVKVKQDSHNFETHLNSLNLISEVKFKYSNYGLNVNEWIDYTELSLYLTSHVFTTALIVAGKSPAGFCFANEVNKFSLWSRKHTQWQVRSAKCWGERKNVRKTYSWLNQLLLHPSIIPQSHLLDSECPYAILLRKR